MTPPWLIPDPDESDEADVCLCDVCGAEVSPLIKATRVKRVERKRTSALPKDMRRVRAKVPMGGTYQAERRRDPSRPVVCSECRVKGWRGKWCACGSVLHKRDYPQAHRKVGACGKCRAEMYEARRADAA